MELPLIVIGLFTLGLFTGVYITWRLVFPAYYQSLRESAEEIYELYKKKRDNCPAYLIKRAKSISAEKAPDDAERDKHEVVSKNGNTHAFEACKVLNDGKRESHHAEKCIHDYCCRGCNHTLAECCEVDKGDIIQVINKVIAGK